MAVVRREIDCMGAQRLAMPGDLDLERRHAVEPGGKTADEAAGYVLNDQNGNGKVARKLGEDVLQRRRAAGRGGNDDHAMTPWRRGRRAPRRDRPRLLPAAHQAHLRQGGDERGEFRTHRRTDGCFRYRRRPAYGERARPQRMERQRDVARIGAIRQNHDRRRAFDHDPLGRLDAVGLGQDRVHEQNVRTQPAHLVERGNAVARLGDDRERGIGLERAGNGAAAIDGG